MPISSSPWSISEVPTESSTADLVDRKLAGRGALHTGRCRREGFQPLGRNQPTTDLTNTVSPVLEPLQSDVDLTDRGGYRPRRGCCADSLYGLRSPVTNSLSETDTGTLLRRFCQARQFVGEALPTFPERHCNQLEIKVLPTLLGALAHSKLRSATTAKWSDAVDWITPTSDGVKSPVWNM